MSTQKYSRQDTIDALQFVADKIGKSPSVPDYRANKKVHHPSVSSICNNFGSWNNAKELAGLDTFNNTRKVRYSKKEVINSIQSVADKIGKSPSKREYIAHKKDHHPSINWICRNLRSWNNAKDAAGLKQYESSDNSYKDKESLVKEIKRRVKCEECGLEEPDRKLHFHHVEPDTKVDGIRNMIDSNYSVEELKTEIKKCEILCDTCHGHEHSKTVTKEDCINAVQSIADQLGHAPSSTEYRKQKKNHHPSVDSIYKHLNSWSNAKEAVNVESTQTTLQSDFASPSRNDE